mgnify:CR=1 FL=1|jgi:hypothetical protein
MRCKGSEWFEVKFAYNKTMENGTQKLVTELYVVEAMSFTEAEAKIIEEMSHYVDGDYKIKAISIPQYKEIWFSDNSSDDKFYKAKLQFVIIDEKTNKEKKSNVFYLVQAGSFDAAKKYIEETMKGTMIDYDIASLKETAVMDVFENAK